MVNTTLSMTMCAFPQSCTYFLIVLPDLNAVRMLHIVLAYSPDPLTYIRDHHGSSVGLLLSIWLWSFLQGFPDKWSWAEEVRHDVMFKLHHALACTINILLAITYKYSWLLKPRFSRYFAGGSEWLSRLKGFFLKTNIVELKIGLNFKGILVSHSPEVR